MCLHMGVFGCVCVRGALYFSVWVCVCVCVYVWVFPLISIGLQVFPSRVSSSLLPPVHLVLYMSGHAPFLWPSWFLFVSAHIVTGPPSPWSPRFSPRSLPPWWPVIACVSRLPLPPQFCVCMFSSVCRVGCLCISFLTHTCMCVCVCVFVGVHGDV